MNIGIALVFLLVCLFGVYKFRQSKRIGIRTEKLRANWERAMENRKIWKDCYPYAFDFSHYEYQRLWEIEIGAEYLYLMFGKCFESRRSVLVSLREYRRQKKKWEAARQ